jgi:hypothetical protein
LEDLPSERTTTNRGRLSIVRLSFENMKKWEFYYEGYKIQANIIDEQFIARINRGERFAKGDALEVEIEITQRYDPTVDAFINKVYKINKFIRSIRLSDIFLAPIPQNYHSDNCCFDLKNGVLV